MKESLRLIESMYKSSFSKFSIKEKEEIAIKLVEMKKEEINLECQCIKFSVKVMSQILNYFETIANEQIEEDINDLLSQVKLFSQITRLVIQKVDEELIKEKENQKKKEFFTLIKVYTEKIHHRLYSLSNVILEKIVNIQMQNKDNEIKHTKVSDSLSIPLNSF